MLIIRDMLPADQSSQQVPRQWGSPACPGWGAARRRRRRRQPLLLLLASRGPRVLRSLMPAARLQPIRPAPHPCIYRRACEMRGSGRPVKCVLRHPRHLETVNWAGQGGTDGVQGGCGRFQEAGDTILDMPLPRFSYLDLQVPLCCSQG